MLIVKYGTDEFKYLVLYMNIYLSQKKIRPAIAPLFNKLNEKIQLSQKYKVSLAISQRKYLRQIIMYEIETGAEHPKLSQNNLRFLYNALLPKGKRKLKLTDS